MKKNAVYIQSGGPTTVINSSFYGVIKGYFKHKDKIDKLYGSRFGIKGLIKNDLVLINKPLKHYEELIKKNGAALGTARLKLNENDSRFFEIINTIKKRNIGYIFFNGGNDSMDTANKLKNYFKKNKIDCRVMGIPKTVDNDLVLTDHVPGYPSACKYIYEVFKGVYQDANSYDEPRINIIEILCRDSGWLAAASSLASLCDMGPDFIYLPEIPFDKNKFIKDVKNKYKEKGNVIIAVAISLVDKNKKFIASVTNVDKFGHEYFSSVGTELEKLIHKNFKCNTRVLSLGIIERDLALLNSKVDVIEAISCGEKAVEFILKNKQGMVSLIREKSSKYKITYDVADFKTVANGVKYFPKKWINKNGNNVTKDYLNYAKSFIDLEETKVIKNIL